MTSVLLRCRCINVDLPGKSVSCSKPGQKSGFRQVLSKIHVLKFVLYHVYDTGVEEPAVESSGSAQEHKEDR